MIFLTKELIQLAKASKYIKPLSLTISKCKPLVYLELYQVTHLFQCQSIQFKNYRTKCNYKQEYSFCLSASKELEIDFKEAQQLVIQEKFNEAKQKLYILDDKTKLSVSLLRCQILNELSITEKEQGLFDSAKLYIEECINILEKKLQNMGQLQFERNFLLADAYLSKANILSQQKDEINSIQFLDQSKTLLNQCLSNIENQQDQQQINSKQKVLKKLALVLTRTTIVNIALRKISEAKMSIQSAQDIWNQIIDKEQLKSYKFFIITKAIIDIITGNHDEGIKLLQKQSDTLVKELETNQHIARMYMSSLLLLLPIYKKKDSQKFQQILKDFDQGLAILKKKQDYSFKQLYNQLQPMRKLY